MPLTTRPSLTSRQGMTRTLNMALRRVARGANEPQGFRRIEAPIIERAAGDGAGELARARREQSLHIGDRGEAARGDDRDAHPLGERDGGIEVEALEQAV